VITCGRCGAENPDGFRFCGSCASPLEGGAGEAREERKVVTALFADLVGFTGKAEQLDPEDVRAMLSPYYARLRDELQRFGGTVEKFIGDAVVALFGAPVAHEDDPERAVRAALAIREAVSELNGEDPGLDLHVRVGVNTGEALVTLDARPSEGEGMAAGDVVNTASRLQASAPVDGILVGDATYRATAAAIEYREADPVAAKGKAEPVRAWEALEARARLGVDVVWSAAAPLVGRERELAVLTGALARAREERSTQLVTLVGEPGIGKSRLVGELLQVVERDPDLIFWRQGRSLPYGEGVSFWALAEMVKNQAGILETDPDDAAGGKLDQAVGRLVTEGEDGRWIVGHLRPLVGLGSDELRGDRQAEAFAAWRRFFEAMAERDPTVLVFEDLHWADDGLLDFVDHLVEWATGVPLLVVCTARPELLARRPGWGGGKPNSATASLSPLSSDDTARLLAHLLERSVLPAEVQTALLTRAGGNPLYAEEFARMAADRDLVERPESLPLPESVQGIIAARLDGLTTEEKTLLQDASVLGKVFWVGGASAIGGMDRRRVEELLHGLERRQFVRRDRRSSVAGETEYAFWHLLVRDVAYGQIPRGRRAEKHRTAAEWTAGLAADRVEDRAEMIAHHYLAALEFARAAGQSTEPLEGSALQALIVAGDRAVALNAFGAAARFYGEAAALAPADHPERPGILFRYGRARWLHQEAGAEELTEAAELLLAAGDVEGAAEAEMMVGDLMWHEARRDAAFERFDSARALVESRPASPSKAWVLGHVSRFLMLAGRNEEAIDVGRQALEMGQGLGLDHVRALAMNNIGTARSAMGDREGLGDLEASIALAADINSPWDESRGYLNLASITGNLGDLRGCQALHERATEISRRYGLGAALRFLRGERALDLFEAGDWEGALRLAEEFLAEVEAGSPHYMEGACRLVRAYIRLARDNPEGAVGDARRAADVAREAKDPQVLQPSLAEEARVLLMAGQPRAAEAAADELLAIAAAEEGHLIWSLWFVPLSLVLSSVGRATEVPSLAERARPVTPWIRAGVAIAEGDLTRAADVLSEIGSLPHEAYLRLLAAELLVSDGRRSEAEDELALALAFFRGVEATAYVRRGEALLGAAATSG
jgi:class 3 adenylate cyclase/tetratricopeptide (TPR) repeat protein